MYTNSRVDVSVNNIDQYDQSWDGDDCYETAPLPVINSKNQRGTETLQPIQSRGFKRLPKKQAPRLNQDMNDDSKIKFFQNKEHPDITGPIFGVRNPQITRNITGLLHSYNDIAKNYLLFSTQVAEALVNMTNKFSAVEKQILEIKRMMSEEETKIQLIEARFMQSSCSSLTVSVSDSSEIVMKSPTNHTERPNIMKFEPFLNPLPGPKSNGSQKFQFPSSNRRMA